MWPSLLELIPWVRFILKISATRSGEVWEGFGTRQILDLIWIIEPLTRRQFSFSCRASNRESLWNFQAESLWAGSVYLTVKRMSCASVHRDSACNKERQFGPIGIGRCGQRYASKNLHYQGLLKMVPPRVFVSYSHDSAEHKSWVLDFATTLRLRGIDTVLDQWDLRPGDDLPHFMETELAKCDFVIIVCSEAYVAKANAGKGGVGYEKMIVTASLLTKIDSNIIIPVVRQSSSAVLPTFLQTKLYIDFSNDSEVEYSLDELIRVLLNAPLYEKPEIGVSPFKPLQGSKPDRTADGLKAAMAAIAVAFKDSPYDDLAIGQIRNFTDIHRLKLERYLSQAETEGLVERNLINKYSVTNDGFDYLVSHGVIDA